MRCWASAVLVLALAACDREGREPSRGAARPLSFESTGDATALPVSDAKVARVAPVGCMPGAHRCVQEKLEACDPRQGGWVQVNVCQTAAHCNGKLKQCLVDPCILGEHQCDGALLQQCHANGWTTVRNCGSAETCDADNGSCR